MRLKSRHQSMLSAKSWVLWQL